MTEALSPRDVARLLQEPSAAMRAEVAAKVARQIDDPRLSPQELSLAQEIARIMARDVALAVRRALADSLRRARRLPREVALRLAEDIDAVALPILAESPVLTDDDLLRILHHASPRKQEAIAARPNLAAPVCDAVAESAEEPAVAALMRNPTASLTLRSLHRAIDRFAASQAVQESIVHRASLPMDIAERLVTVISDRMRDYLVSHHALPSDSAADIILRGRERAMLQLSQGAGQDELLRLLRQMHWHQRLTPTLALRAVCSGDVAFFTAALAVMAGVPVTNAELLVNDPGGRGLVSLCDKAGVPAGLLPLIRAALEVTRGTGLDGGERDWERFRARVIGRVLTQCEDLDPEDLDYLVERMPAAVAG
ncbi:MAG TPA: DUF2336 domain-containing protein [Acetobacteraceae bacterium]|nr:DUF2336 domain-containing protein [Acetobacteraceae bacterium]